MLGVVFLLWILWALSDPVAATFPITQYPTTTGLIIGSYVAVRYF